MLTIAVDGQLEARLKHVASSAGTDPQAVARQVLDENLPADNSATLALLDQWDAEDAAADPADRERHIRESEELLQNLDRRRAEQELRELREFRSQQKGAWLNDEMIDAVKRRD